MQKTIRAKAKIITRRTIALLLAVLCTFSANELETFASSINNASSNSTTVEDEQETPLTYQAKIYTPSSGLANEPGDYFVFKATDTKRTSAIIYKTIGFTISRFKKYTQPSKDNDSSDNSKKIDETNYYRKSGEKEYIELSESNKKEFKNAGSVTKDGKVVTTFNVPKKVVYEEIGFNVSDENDLSSIEDWEEAYETGEKTAWAKSIVETIKYSYEASDGKEPWAYIGVDAIMTTAYISGGKTTLNGALKNKNKDTYHYEKTGLVWTALDAEGKGGRTWATWNGSSYTGGIRTAQTWSDSTGFRQRYGNYINLLRYDIEEEDDPDPVEPAAKDTETARFYLIKNWSEENFDSTGTSVSNVNTTASGSIRTIHNNTQSNVSGWKTSVSVTSDDPSKVTDQWTFDVGSEKKNIIVYAAYDGSGNISGEIEKSDGSSYDMSSSNGLLTHSFSSISAGSYTLTITHDAAVEITTVGAEDTSKNTANHVQYASQVSIYKLRVAHALSSSAITATFKGSGDISGYVLTPSGSKIMMTLTESAGLIGSQWSEGTLSADAGYEAGDYTVVLEHTIGYSTTDAAESDIIGIIPTGVTCNGSWSWNEEKTETKTVTASDGAISIVPETTVVTHTENESYKGTKISSPLEYTFTTTEHIDNAYVFVTYSGNGSCYASLKGNGLNESLSNFSFEDSGLHILAINLSSLPLGTYTLSVVKDSDVTVLNAACEKTVQADTGITLTPVAGEDVTVKETTVAKGRLTSGDRFAAPGLYTGSYIYDADKYIWIEETDKDTGVVTGKKLQENDAVTYTLGSTLSKKTLNNYLDNGTWDPDETDEGGIPTSASFYNTFEADTWYGHVTLAKVTEYDNDISLYTKSTQLSIAYTAETSVAVYGYVKKQLVVVGWQTVRYTAHTVVSGNWQCNYRIGAQYYQWQADNLFAIDNYSVRYIRSDSGDSFTGIRAKGTGNLFVERPDYILGQYSNDSWDKKWGDGSVGSGSHLGNRTIYRNLVRNFMRGENSYTSSVDHTGYGLYRSYYVSSWDDPTILGNANSLVRNQMNNGMYARAHNDYFALDGEVYLDDSTPLENYTCDNSGVSGKKHYRFKGATDFARSDSTASDGEIMTYMDLNDSAYEDTAAAKYGNKTAKTVTLSSLGGDEYYNWNFQTYICSQKQSGPTKISYAAKWYGPKTFTVNKQGCFNIEKCHEFSDDWETYERERNLSNGMSETVTNKAEYDYKVVDDVIYCDDVLVTIPESTSNGYYFTDLNVRYEKIGQHDGGTRQIVINDLSDTYGGYMSQPDQKGAKVSYGNMDSASDDASKGERGKMRAILRDSTSDPDRCYRSNEPIRIFSPASAPVSIESEATQLADMPDDNGATEEYTNNSVRKFAQLQLDGEYTLHFTFDDYYTGLIASCNGCGARIYDTTGTCENCEKDLSEVGVKFYCSECGKTFTSCGGRCPGCNRDISKWYGEYEYFAERYANTSHAHSDSDSQNAFGADLNGDGYADAGYTKYLKDKQIRFPFTVQIAGKVYEPIYDVDGKLAKKSGKEAVYTKWISLGSECTSASFTIPTWAEEGAYGLIKQTNATGITMYDGWDSKNRSATDYNDTGIQVRVLANNYIAGKNNKTEYNYITKMGCYAAVYNYSCYVCGVMYSYQTNAINDETFGGLTKRDTGIYNFVKNYGERIVGTQNRWGNNTIRYTKDGTTTGYWDWVDTLPFTSGKNRYFKEMGWLQMGDKFSFSIKTISSWLTNTGTSEKQDLLDVTPTYKYITPGGTVYDWENIHIFYEDDEGNIVEMGSVADQANAQQIALSSKYFEDTFYDYTYDTTEYTADKNGLTVGQLLNREQGASSMGDILINNLQKLFTADEDQLHINEIKTADEALRYTAPSAGGVGEELLALSDEQYDDFKESMQTWYGIYEIPDKLYVCTDEDYKKYIAGNDGYIDLSNNVSYDADGNVVTDSGLWLTRGYLELNFEIVSYTEISESDYQKITKNSNKYSYTDEDGTTHYFAATMKYYLNEGGLNMWDKQKDGRVTDPYTEEVKDVTGLTIDTNPGDIAIISLDSSLKDRYQTGYVYIN